MSEQTSANTESPAGEETIEGVSRQRDEYLDQLRRTQAEFMNFQKRSKTLADSDRQYMVGGLALDLIGVLDNFERAAEAARTSGSTVIVEGLDLVHKQLMAALAKHAIEPISALGQPFDPNQHEAIMQQPDAFHPEGTVVAELGKGYRIRDRVLRPSKVAVSVLPEAS